MLQKRLPGAPLKTATPGWSDARVGADLAETLERAFSAVRRRWLLLVVFVAAAMALGGLYVMTAVPLYTASVTILTNQATTKLVDEISASDIASADDGALRSQVEILKSEKVGYRVVDALDLGRDEDFLAGVPTTTQRLTEFARGLFAFNSWFDPTPPSAPPTDARRRAALNMLRANLSVQRVGRTFALDVGFTSPDPVQAAEVAAAYGDAYIADQLDTMYDATRTAGDWLQQRIEELRKLAVESDLAVQKYRTENGLIATDGVLVTEQNLSEINTRLIQAQQDTAEAQARYDRIREILDSGSTDALVSDALDSALINQLREKYLVAAKREAEIIKQLGPEHISAVRFRAEMDEYSRQMFDELRRIAESYQSDVEVAKSKEDSIRASMQGARSDTIASGEVAVQLRELERQAETYKTLYEKFLERYQQAVQQESFPITEARIINDAKVPTSPSSPNIPLVMALCGLVGLAGGVGFGAMREYRDRFFRTGDQIRSELNLPFIGISPKVAPGTAVDADPVAARPPHPRQMHTVSPTGRYVVDHPQSQLAETLRSAQFFLEMALGERRPRVIGVVSVLPGEGKTTMSLNLAQLLAAQGSKTLIVDGDLRRPGLTQAAGRHATVGLLEALLDRRPLKDIVLLDRDSGLAMVPAVVKQRVTHSSELLASEGMDDLLAAASAAFETIVIDLPPLLPVVDARAIASRVDAFIMVVAWGETSRRVVRTALESEPQIAEKCVGVILNKVDQDKMKYYWSYGSTEYYYSRYSSYHNTRVPD